MLFVDNPFYRKFYNLTNRSFTYLQAKSIKILFIMFFVDIVNFMSDSLDPKNQIIDRSSDKGLFVNDDDQDWGSAGMNNVQEDSE